MIFASQASIYISVDARGSPHLPFVHCSSNDGTLFCWNLGSDQVGGKSEPGNVSCRVKRSTWYSTWYSSSIGGCPPHGSICKVSLFKKRDQIHFIPSASLFHRYYIYYSFFRYVPVGRSFFSEPAPGAAVDLGIGCEIWFGHYQSIRPTQWGMLVNLDYATTAFHKTQPVIAFLEECIKRQIPGSLNDAHRLQCQKSIKGICIH